MRNFWQELAKPIFCLAPMADVTDCAFRQIIAKYGKPAVMFTEFVSADGLAHPAAREKLLVDLKYSESERPVVAQIFSGRPENIELAAALCQSLGFDGLDINMGCPANEIVKQCAGAALIKDPELAKEIIRAAKRGAPNLPISIKTRIGYNKSEIETFLPALLEEDLAAIIIHLRTKKEMSAVPAHWELMRRIVEIRDEMKKDTLIIGNGDTLDLEDAQKKVNETGCDGVMLGRAIFGNPWLFGGEMSRLNLDIKEKLKVMVEHTKLFEKLLMFHPAQDGSALGGKNFAIMKKHYKAYVNGFDGAKELRIKLMEGKDSNETEKLVTNFLLTNN